MRRMVVLLLSFVAVSVVQAAANYRAFLDTGGNFTTIDVPGVVDTYGYGDTYGHGVNDQGQIVGDFMFLDTGVGLFYTHGFLYSGGTFTKINVPGADFTSLRGINDAGQIVGVTHLTGQGASHGLLYSGGSFTFIDVPGAFETFPVGINDAGQIVGGFAYPNEEGGHGFLYNNGVFTVIDVPGALPGSTAVTGINDAGQIVGTFLDQTIWRHTHGFVDTAGTFTTFDAPFFRRFETAGINDAGQVVGSFDYGQQGFLYSGGTFTNFDFPDATLSYPVAFTNPEDINDAGQIVGTYFEVTPEPGSILLLGSGVAGIGALTWRRHGRTRAGSD